MRLAYVDGIDGWIDDGLAFTRPWGFDVSTVTTRTSIWYGTEDVLAAQDHHEYLLAHIADAERHQLAGGHLLTRDQLAAIYAWLATAGE
jgi:predicted esterase